ncbi:hypothetical protein SAMN05216582_12729 [Selenomonas ruminantium]|uniref:Uncharacterized protein n=1 Tax=Selenomonas ruminantium TaxID=971 RepID=A0A1M6WQN3_SELRU|nr:hypothetical protein [Selenomonas ruminantium]SHK96028.1 hypothetical protein SAMN05216582_12729 [Selenomonas ruminantium]
MKQLIILLLSIVIISNGFCSAEVKVFSGSAKSEVMLNETLDDTKERLLHQALRSIAESAGVYVESYTKVENQVLKSDITTVISSAVVKVNCVEYSPVLYNDVGQRELSVNVTATVDTDNVLKMSQKLQVYENELILANEKIKKLRDKLGDDSRFVLNDPVPNIIITHNALWGEVDINQLLHKTHIIPKINIPIYKEPYENSKIVSTESAGQYLNVIATEMHSFPKKGKTKIINNPFEDFIHIRGTYSSINAGRILPSVGDYIYLLRYSGEGVYQALYRDNIISVPYNGIKNISDKYDMDGIHRGFYAVFEGTENSLFCEEWICVKNIQGLEGWVLLKEKNDWQLPLSRNQGQGIFHYNHF